MGNCLKHPKEDESKTPEPETVGRPDGEYIRLFLIGNGEVGKSTLIKQMQNLCLTVNDYSMFDENWTPVYPFSDIDRSAFTMKIHQNIFRVIGTLIVQAERMNLDYSDSQHRQYSEDIMQYIQGEIGTLYLRQVQLTPQMAEKIASLWFKDKAIQQAWERRREFIISDSTEYFLDPSRLKKIAAPGYIPTVDDIIRVRDPTTGIKDYNFRLHGLHFTIHDMGGQPVERSRIPCYMDNWLKASRPGDRNFILYVAAMSDYNQKRRLCQRPNSDDESTILDESVALLQILLNMEQLQNCGFLLFLNKRDIFEQKIRTFKDFNHFFQRHLPATMINQPCESLAHAEKIVASRFADAVYDSKRPDEQLYIRFTTAVDPTMMETIFHAVENHVITDIFRRGSWVPFAL